EEQRKLDSATIFRKGLRIYTDAVQLGLYEYNIGAEYAWSPRFTVGANFGIGHHGSLSYTYDISLNNVFATRLAMVDGHTGRAFIKYYSRRNPSGYWCFQAVYKSIWASTLDTYYFPEGYSGFINIHGTVTGQDFIRGYEYWTKNKKFFIDLYFGIGLREQYSKAFYPATDINYKTNTSVYGTPILDLNFGYKLF
ncbi:MAG TPA: hypothetical protein VN922_22545, partial [Bacteroidia bacterium]|nr:hypothetical protein [Bacteroidia bacterium]